MRSSCLPPIAAAVLAVAASMTAPAMAQSVVITQTTEITIAASAVRIADDPLILTAEVKAGASAAVPDGRIAFYDLTTSRVLGWAEAARPRIEIHGLSPGRHLIRADYSGTDGYLPLVVLPSQSQPLALDVLARPELALSSQQGPIAPGAVVTLVATIAGSEGNGHGAVTFRDGEAVIAADVPLDCNGRASFTTSALAEGVRHIVATYAGDAHYAPASAAIDQVVAPQFAAAE